MDKPLRKDDRFGSKVNQKKYDSSGSDSETYNKSSNARNKEAFKNGSNHLPQYRLSTKYQNDSDDEPSSYRKKENKTKYSKNYSDEDEEDIRRNKFDGKNSHRSKIIENSNLNESTMSSTNVSKNNLKSDSNEKNKEKVKLLYLYLINLHFNIKNIFFV